jgi:hypothetical protein
VTGERRGLRRSDLEDQKLTQDRESHDAVALNDFARNFIRIHRTLRTSPAMAVGCDVEALGESDLVGLLEAAESKKHLKESS